MFVEDVRDRLPALVSKLPGDWDLVQLIYATQDVEPVADSVVQFRMLESMPVASAGYVIRKSGAIKMRDNGSPCVIQQTR